MALIKCPECKKKISNQCENCPKCGYPINSNSQNEILESENLEDIKILQDEIQNKKLAQPKNRKKKTVILSIGGILLLISALLIFMFTAKSSSVEEIRQSVVKINVYDKNGDIIQTGSGFVIFDKNTLITNAHVISNGHTVDAVTESDERIYIDGAVYYSQDEDIAILKINGKSSIKALNYSEKYKVGEKVIAIGSPLGIKNSVSEGVVSNSFEDGTIQHSAPISSGSSGGTLFNAKGRVIGMNTATLTSGQNLNLAIPISKLKEAYEKSKDNKVKSINKIQVLNYKDFKTVLLNNEAGKNIIDIVKSKSNVDSIYATESNNSSYIDTYFMTQIINEGIASNWVEIYANSYWDNEKIYHESKIPQVKIIKINNISDDEIHNLMVYMQEEVDQIYSDLIRYPYDTTDNLINIDGKFVYNDNPTKHYYSQEYINAFKEPILKYSNGYIYKIVCKDKNLAKQIEKEIQNLP